MTGSGDPGTEWFLLPGSCVLTDEFPHSPHGLLPVLGRPEGLKKVVAPGHKMPEGANPFRVQPVPVTLFQKEFHRRAQFGAELAVVGSEEFSEDAEAFPVPVI